MSIPQVTDVALHLRGHCEYAGVWYSLRLHCVYLLKKKKQAAVGNNLDMQDNSTSMLNQNFKYQNSLYCHHNIKIYELHLLQLTAKFNRQQTIIILS